MGKVQLTIEVDEALMRRLHDAGVEPQVYVERLLHRGETRQEGTEARAERESSLKSEMRDGLEAYDRLVEAAGDWSAELRTF